MSVSPLSSVAQDSTLKYLNGLREDRERGTSAAVEPSAATVATSLQAAQHPASTVKVASTVSPASSAPTPAELPALMHSQATQALQTSQTASSYAQRYFMPYTATQYTSPYVAFAWPTAPPHPYSQQLATMPSLPFSGSTNPAPSLNYQA